MKLKIPVLVLMAISITKIVVAQQVFSSPPTLWPSKTDAMFNSRRVGSLNKRFDFLFLSGNKMVLEFTTDNQVEVLPDIDSLVQEVWKDLSALGDSLNSPLESKRTDVIFSPVDRKIRIQNFPQHEAIFRIQNNDITQLKVEQDTLRLNLFTKSSMAANGFIAGQPYYITFIVNHISDVPLLLKQNGIAETIQLFKNDFASRKFKNRSASFTRYYSLYNVATQKRLIPVKGALNSVGHKTELIPYVQTGIQYLRGGWAPSAGVGLELVSKQSESFETHFYLLWEPYFIFNSDPLKATTLSRNDFLTFKYFLSSTYRGEVRQIEFKQSFSAGYLIRSKGIFFEKNTFKFSLPGLQTKNILLEPEFVFNDFFKNFSPSLKLTLFFE